MPETYSAVTCRKTIDSPARLPYLTGMVRPYVIKPAGVVFAGVILFGLAEPAAVAQDTAHITFQSVLAEIDTALSYIKLTRSDLTLRTDYVDYDSFRLDIVDQVMVSPTDMAMLLDSAANRIFDAGGVSGCLQVVDRAFSREGRDFFDTAYPVSFEKNGCITALLAAIPNADPIVGEYLSSCPLACRPLRYYWQFFQGTDLAAAIVTGWLPEDSTFLIDTLPQLLIEDPEAEFYPPEKIDSLQKVSERIAERFVRLSGQVKWQRQVGALLALSREQLFFAQRLEASLPDSTINLASQGKIEFGTPAGKVALGGTGNDHYTGKYFFIFDPGGDDVYDLAPMAPGDNQAIYDLSGNDIYIAAEGYGLGCGFFGFGFLYDREGDDTYRAGNFSLGSGFFGAGMLIDLAGNDVYISDTYSQGAGAFGYGFIYDHSGNDQYTSALYSQGFGFAAGVGLLADRSGNDTYFAGGKYKDILRYKDRYLSLSQGFSYGVRPDFSGGVGWLLDGAGNDVYTCDIFGQGCSYWWAFGGLYDGGGNDNYNCYQYGQGSATHMAAGILYDRAGSDVYYGKGLMQGCGHDRSTGWLLDLTGNDTYTCADLSQGAGSANGTGMLIDGSGEDRYYVKNPANTQAYGNPRRDFGSIGIFLDLGGADRYDGNGRDDDIWMGNSRWGVGVDKNSPPEVQEK